VIADHLADGVRAAEGGGHQAFLVELDTPGGLDAAMRQIVQAFLNARVPVVVHVAPAGARAASAGPIITSSAHVAAMAPGTTIGAAIPVDLQGGEIPDEVLNDAASFAESVAAQRGRNTTFAVQTVREGRSVTGEEAGRIGAVDLLAPDRQALLAALDGRRVQLGPDTAVTLRTAGARTVEHDLSTLRGLLQRLADPNLAFVFLSIGTLAVIYERATGRDEEAIKALTRSQTAKNNLTGERNATLRRKVSIVADHLRMATVGQSVTRQLLETHAANFGQPLTAETPRPSAWVAEWTAWANANNDGSRPQTGGPEPVPAGGHV
jgi:hypothetical protein